MCAQLSLLVVWAVPTVTTIWSAFSSDSVPFPLVVVSSSALPAQGFLNAILFVILLGRARKRLERTVSVLGTDYGEKERERERFCLMRLADFAIDEVRVSLFGETVLWYFSDAM